MHLREFIRCLGELRREPEQNPRVPVAHALAGEIVRMEGSSFAGSGYINLFVHMSNIVKLGFNPRADYGETPSSATPAGIYAYPAEYAHDVTNGDHDLHHLPYGGDRDLAHVFSYRGPQESPAVLDLQSLTWTEVDQLLDLIGESIPPEGRIQPGKSFWQYTRKLAQNQTWSKPRRSGLRQIAPISLKWRELLTAMGIRAVLDRRGVIFPGEDVQAVFLYPTDLDQKALLHNRWDPQSRLIGIEKGQRSKSRLQSSWWQQEQQQQKALIASGERDLIDDWIARHPYSPEIVRGFLRKIRDPQLLAKVLSQRPRLITMVDKITPQLVLMMLEDLDLGFDQLRRQLWREVSTKWHRSPNLYSELMKLLIGLPRSQWQRKALEHLIMHHGQDGKGYPGLSKRLRLQALALLSDS